MSAAGAAAERIAIVTGAGSGIGQALAHALADPQAVPRVRVVVGDVREDAARATAREIGQRGGLAEAVWVDVTRTESLEALVDGVVGAHGRLDYMFNNAGLGAWGDVRELTREQWSRIIDVNLWGVVHGSLLAYAHMARQGSGHIVNSASLAGLVPAPVSIPYATAKHAVVGFSLSLRAEAAGLGVKVSTVCPGPIATGFHRALERPAGQGAEARPPSRSVDAASAAKLILHGVSRNRRLIVFPGRARLLWLYWRFAPYLLDRVNRATVRRLRALARED